MISFSFTLFSILSIYFMLPQFQFYRKWKGGAWYKHSYFWRKYGKNEFIIKNCEFEVYRHER